LTRILSANIRVNATEGGNGPGERPVASILVPLLEQNRSTVRPRRMDDARDLLEAKGIAVVERNGTNRVFLAHDVVRRELLKDTRWSGSRIDEILARIPGAERCQQRCGGLRPHGILLPAGGCLAVLLGQDSEQDSASEAAN